VHEKIALARKKLKTSKYTEIQTITIDVNKILKSDKNELKAEPKIQQCRSVNDLRHIGGCRDMLCECSYSTRGLKKMTGNLKDFRDLQALNEKLTNELENEKLQHKESQRVLQGLERDNERLLFEMRKLEFTNQQIQKTLDINNNADEIQQVINELSSIFLSSSRKKLNITDKQYSLIRNLFGDVATQAYKDKIRIIEENLESKTHECIELRQELKHFMGSYLDDVHRFETPHVSISAIKTKLKNNKVRYNPKILKE
jgi:hypothetical protein